MASTDFTTQITNAFNAIHRAAPAASDISSWNTTLNNGVTTVAQMIISLSNDSIGQITQGVTALYQAAFNRAPDTGGLTYWVNQIQANGNSIYAIGQAFLTSQEAINLYGSPSSNSTSFVTALYTQVLGRVPSSSELAYYTSGAGNTSVGLTLTHFSQSPEATTNFASAMTTFLNAAAGGSTTVYTTATTKAVFYNASTATTTANTFALTTGSDNPACTSGNDLITGFATTGTATGDTFGPADIINGGAGTDTLSLTLAGTVAATAQISNVEVLQIRAAANSTMDAGAGYTTINDTNTASAVTLGLSNIANNATIGFANVTSSGTQTFTFAANALASATATLALTESSVGSTAQSVTEQFVTAGTDSVTSISIAATGANYITTENTNSATNVWQSDKTLTITGTGSLKIVGGANTLGNITTIVASGNSGGVDIDLATGTNAQNVTFTGGSGNDRISFAATKFDINDKIDLGAGTNTLAIGDATVTTAGAASLITAIKAVANDQVLEMTVSGANAATLNTANVGLDAYVFSGAVTGLAAGTAGVSAAGGSAGTGLSADTILGETNTNTFAFNASETGSTGGAGATAGSGTAVTGGIGGTAATFTPGLDNGNNILTLTLKGVTLTGGDGGVGAVGATAGVGGAAINAATFESVSITTTGTAASALVAGSAGAANNGTAATAGNGITVGTNGVITVAGAQDLNLGDVGGTNASVSASNFTGKLTVGMLTGNTTVTGGSGDDTILIAPGANATSTVNGGTGADKIWVVGAGDWLTKTGGISVGTAVASVQQGAANHADVLTGGVGNDTFYFAASTLANVCATSAGTTSITSIKDFAAGTDKIGLIDGAGAFTSITLTTQTIATAADLTAVYAGIATFTQSTESGAVNAAVITVSGGAAAGTYLCINNATNTISNSADMLINITGITGTLAASDFVFA